MLNTTINDNNYIDYLKTSIKEASTALEEFTLISVKAFHELQSAFDFSNMERSLSAVVLLLGNTESSFNNASDALKLNTNLTEQLIQVLQNENKEFKNLQNTLEETKDDYNDVLTNGITPFTNGLGISRKAIHDTIESFGGAIYSLSILLSIAASLKMVYPAAFSALSESVTTAVEYIIPSLGELSGVLIGILILSEEISLQMYNVDLAEKRLRENTPLISSTQPGQDNLKYIKYDDDHNIMSFEDADKLFHLTEEETNNVTSEGTGYSISNQGIKSKNTHKTLQHNSSNFSYLFNAEPEQLDEVEQKLKELQKTETQYQDAVTKGYIGLAKIKSDLITQLNKEIDEMEHGKNLNISDKFGDIESLTKNVKGLKNDYSFLSKGKINDALKGENRVLPTEAEALKQAFDGIKGAVSGISNIMNILQVGADTFVGRLLSGFSATLSIVDSIVAVINSINQASSGIGILGDIFGGLLSIIPGGGAVKALAGAAGGMPHYSGSSGMPNINSLRSMSPGRSYNPNISVMVHSEIGRQASYKVLVDGRIYESKKADR